MATLDGWFAALTGKTDEQLERARAQQVAQAEDDERIRRTLRLDEPVPLPPVRRFQRAAMLA